MNILDQETFADENYGNNLMAFASNIFLPRRTFSTVSVCKSSLGLSPILHSSAVCAKLSVLKGRIKRVVHQYIKTNGHQFSGVTK